MIRIIKLGNLIYENVEPKIIDESGNEIWNIPNDLSALKNAIIDTLGWIVSQKILKVVQSADKKDASTSKAVCLLAKIISTLNPDLSQLTQKEQDAFDKMLNIANTGYTDSDLLNASLQAILDNLQWYAEKANEANNLSTVEEMIEFLENINP